MLRIKKTYFNRNCEKLQALYVLRIRGLNIIAQKTLDAFLSSDDLCLAVEVDFLNRLFTANNLLYLHNLCSTAGWALIREGDNIDIYLRLPEILEYETDHTKIYILTKRHPENVLIAKYVVLS